MKHKILSTLDLDTNMCRGKCNNTATKQSKHLRYFPYKADKHAVLSVK